MGDLKHAGLERGLKMGRLGIRLCESEKWQAKEWGLGRLERGAGGVD